MGKNQSASGLTNVIQYSNSGITFVSASTTLGTLNSSGSLSVTQNITGSNVLATGNIVAQTLVVQTVTSSINYSSGSNIFGNQLTNTQQFTGSVRVTGSLTVATTNPELTVGATGVTLGNVLTDVHQVTGSLRVTGSGNHFIQGGSVGIGTASPDIFGRGDAQNVGISVVGASDNMALQLNAGSTAGRGAQIYMGQGGTRHFTLSSNATETTIGTTSNTPLRFTTNDTERMRITSGGNIEVTTTTFAQVKINNAATTGTNRGTSFEVNSTTNAGTNFIGQFNAVSNNANAPYSSTDGIYLMSRTSGIPLIFTTNNGGTEAERMRITSAGNVGIGTTNISTEANLHLGANGTLEGGQLILQRGTTQASASHLDNYQNRFRVLSGNDTTSTAERFSVDMTNSHVGIGITPSNWTNQGPAIQFGAQGAISAIQYSGANNQVSIANNAYVQQDTGFYYIASNPAGLMRIVNSGEFQWLRAAAGSANAPITAFNRQMTLADTGDLLIGTTTNSSQRLRIYQPTNGNWNIKLVQPNGSNQLFQEFLTTTDGDANVTARGSITYNGTNVLYNATSDYRLKEDLKDYNAMSIIDNLKTYDFKWKESGNRDYGMMAHELQEILPNYVFGKKDAVNEDGTIMAQGIDYSKLTPILIKAIQELKAEIDILKNK